jgi:hypothetical protein
MARRKTIGLIVPSNPRYARRQDVRCVLRAISKILERKEYAIILSPDKGSTAEAFAKIHSENADNTAKLIGISYPDDRVGGYPGLNRRICGQECPCTTYELQPGALVRGSDDIVCAGFSAGVFWEMIMTKYIWSRRKNSKVYVIRDIVRAKVPKEIESQIPIEYVTLRQLEQRL